jgi:hypothetical protein
VSDSRLPAAAALATARVAARVANLIHGDGMPPAIVLIALAGGAISIVRRHRIDAGVREAVAAQIAEALG